MPARYQPSTLRDGFVESYDLVELTTDLIKEDAFQKSGRVARTLARGDQMTVVLTAMKKGGELHEHSTPGPVTVTVVSGNVVFAFDGPREDVALREGSSVVLGKRTSHRVKALEDSAFLIVIGERDQN